MTNLFKNEICNRICAIMCYKWVENYTKFNIFHSEQHMDFLKRNMYVVAASNT